MKTFTTTIFVPAKSKLEMNFLEQEIVSRKVNNRAVPISDELGLGALDDLVSDEQFILVVNGELTKHEIKMKVSSVAIGKPRLMLVEPELPEVKRFIEWRIDGTKKMSQRNGSHYQLKNFTIDDMRRLIRTAYANGDRHLVKYR